MANRHSVKQSGFRTCTAATTPTRVGLRVPNGSNRLRGCQWIDDADRLRAGSTGQVLGHRVAAPSTLGTFLRSFTWGSARQLDQVAGIALARPWAAGAGPGPWPLTIDLDSTHCQTYGLSKQGAAADDLWVPIDNNQAEWELRMVTLQQTISGCWRTLAGVPAFLTVRGYVSTARNHEVDPLHALRQSLQQSSPLASSLSRALNSYGV